MCYHSAGDNGPNAHEYQIREGFMAKSTLREQKTVEKIQEFRCSKSKDETRGSQGDFGQFLQQCRFLQQRRSRQFTI
jgi:hypothetical protein